MARHIRHRTWVLESIVALPFLFCLIHLATISMSNILIFHKPGCTREYVELRDGGTETSYLMGGKRHCYTTPSFKITSGNMLWIKFFTDEEATMDGFRIKVSLNLCGGTFYTPNTGLIESPNYPENYPRNTSCQWRLLAPGSHSFSLRVPQLNLPGFRTVNCDRAPDKLKVLWNVPDLADRSRFVI
ncbi:cubilin, partial [Nilaparvata lugens]|uniref:cubilin n=1 Tax=Nilaparvata lugens TaxID=108931 RepID=UPI00193E0907